MISPFTYLKAGDYLVLVSGCLLIAYIAANLWQVGAADKAIIRSGGKVFSVVPLARDQLIAVPGPLGISQIAIHNRQARIAADPSPRQYCVRQGWLKQAGEIAVCLPNQVSIELSGSKKRYDSLNY